MIWTLVKALLKWRGDDRGWVSGSRRGKLGVRGLGRSKRRVKVRVGDETRPSLTTGNGLLSLFVLPCVFWVGRECNDIGA